MSDLLVLQVSLEEHIIFCASRVLIFVQQLNRVNTEEERVQLDMRIELLQSVQQQCILQLQV